MLVVILLYRVFFLSHYLSKATDHTDSLPQTEHSVTVTVFKTTIQKTCHVVSNYYILIFSFSDVKPEKDSLLSFTKHSYKSCLLCKAVPLKAWSGPEGSRKLGFPDFMTTAQDGGRVVSPTQRPPLPPGRLLVQISLRGWVDPRAIGYLLCCYIYVNYKSSPVTGLDVLEGG
jgi:hypothetical protein